MRRVINNIRNHTNWLAYFVYKFGSSRKAPFTFKCRGGLKITVPPRLMQTYKECFFDESYFKGLPKTNNARAPKTVVDIGANVGYFSLSAFVRYPGVKVFAFEPMPMNFKLLQQYRDQNPKLAFTVVNKAVSDREETIVLNYDASDSYTTAATIFDAKGQGDKLEVQTTTLAAILADYGLAQIDFLKLDCEGSEYPILYGASPELLKNIQTMAIETHAGQAANENTAALVAFLQKNGFIVHTERTMIWAAR